MIDSKNLKNSCDRHLYPATIRIRDLRLRTYIGFNPDEREKKQDVVINIEVRYNMSSSVLDDRVEEALNYKTITKNVINHVEGGKFLLLEKLVGDVLHICSEHPDILFASVTIEKPHALRFADSVSLTLEYTSEVNQSVQGQPLTLLEKAS
jgi:D-erythro-7,8-dihydroneopterin triphosphate epimerase